MIMTTRRNMLILAASSACGMTLGTGRVAAEVDLKPLDAQSPAATALHFVDDAATAPTDVYPQGSGQRCDSCIHYTALGGARGSCKLFAGFSVPGNGWCSGWVARNAG
jgi:hypothetical protein